jgi:hypothetical protein
MNFNFFQFEKKLYKKNCLFTVLRRRNQKKMQREFSYRPEKSSTNISQLSPGQERIIADYVIREKTIPLPFNQMTNNSPIKQAYDPSSAEISGTYRARHNNAYDNTDNSLRSNNYGTGDYRNYRVDYDEYWKTNI